MLEVACRKELPGFRLDIGLRIENGGPLALFGRSGAGKSTLVRLIAGLDRPDSGAIRLNGAALYDSTAQICLPPHRRRIGLVFQESLLLPHYSVAGNLAYGLSRVPTAERRIGMAEVVELLGLNALLKRRPATLSGGEARRVAIGRALLTSPLLLLLDEPLSGLDGARKDELLSYIDLLARNFRLPILYVSHHPDEILRLAAGMAVMENGTIVAAGPVETVMALPVFAAAAGSRTLFSIVAARVDSHDAAMGVSRLACAGGVLSVPRLDLPVGSQVRARIPADHVILARRPVQGLSVRNSLSGTVLRVDPLGPMMDVVVDIGCPLHAELTAESCRDLGIAPGQEITVLIKSAAIHGDAVSLHTI